MSDHAESGDAAEMGVALYDYETEKDFVKKAKAAETLARWVRAYMEWQEPESLVDGPKALSFHPPTPISLVDGPKAPSFHTPAINAIDTTLTIWHNRTVTFDGDTYPTAFNAFQAQKEVTDGRKSFTKCSWSEAAALGRLCDIDVAKWNAGREELIINILLQQASQHEDFAKKIVKYGDRVFENSMPDKWWVDAMPRIWEKVRRMLMLVDDTKKGVVEDDDDQDNHDDSDQEDEGSNKKTEQKRRMILTADDKKVKLPKPSS